MPYDPAEDFVKSLPPMVLLRKAAQGGGAVLDLLNKLQGRPSELRRPPIDDMQRQRGGMAELEYRKYLADQLRQGQEMQQQPLEVKPAK